MSLQRWRIGMSLFACTYGHMNGGCSARASVNGANAKVSARHHFRGGKTAA